MAPSTGEKMAYLLKVDGVVQGVGFRPFVYRIAYKYGIKGYVKNLGDAGVEIFVEGRKENVEKFLNSLKNEAPPLAKIENLRMKEVKSRGYKDFRIEKSSKGKGAGDSIIPPDVAICEECLRELFDPKDRRYLYPFIVCTNCGPRFSIIESLPYDRENTSMRDFPMCELCREEYEDPINRRYHAEPTCCEKCGPRYELYTKYGGRVEGEPLKTAARLIDEGKIIAIKGIGGFHIACDATNEEVVRELRKRLGREQQPFAIMVKDINTIKKIAYVNPEEEEELKSYRRPITLLRKKGKFLAESVAPGLHTVGIMLPYAGVHYILFHYSSSPAYVMTSANYPDMPMVKDNEKIWEMIDAVDYILLHNRRIVNRVDDSVVRFVDGKRAVIRRSRGFVPLPIEMPFSYNGIALGAELMNSISIVKKRRIYPSQYIGNTSKIDVMDFLQEAIERFNKILKIKDLDLIIVDSHPLYNTSNFGREMAKEIDLEVLEVQHHYAHIATLLLENKVKEIVGIAVDGVGYGSDGKIWGGEIIYLGKDGVRRYSHITYYPLPGGDLASYYPIRSLAGLLSLEYGEDEITELLYKFAPGAISSLKYGEREFDIILQQIAKRINVSETSSTGRFLDAISSLLGVCYRRTYEGEPAMKLESFALKSRGYEEFSIPWEKEIMVHKILPQILEALGKGMRKEKIAYATHIAIAKALAEKAMEVAENLGIKDIGVSGGVACNQIIIREIRNIVERNGFVFHTTQDIPRGDNGISAGQAYLGGMYLEGYVKKDEVR